MRYKISLAYDGTDFSGWQIQEITNPPLTIQGELEKALSKISGEMIRVIGAGRTDAGVHAHGQVAHFDSNSNKISALPDLRYTLNAVLPKDIRIISAAPAQATFHAQHDAKLKTYIYQLWTEPSFLPPSLARFVWSCGPLNLHLLEKAAELFPGRKNFASFQNAGTNPRDTTRTIESLTIKINTNLPYYPDHLPFIQISVRASGFLKQMVRNIIGYMVGVARNKINPENFETIINAGDRRVLPTATAPAKGLFLAQVLY